MSTSIDTSSAYTKYDSTEWINEETLISADRLNKIEKAILQLQRGESIVVGTVSSERLPVASVPTTGEASNAANRGTVQIYGGRSEGFTNLGQGNPNLTQGYCISPKLLNDLYKNSAEPSATDGTRVAKKAVVATKLEKNVKINLTGGVSSNTISFMSGSDTAYTLNVSVLGTGHTHGLGQLVDCGASRSRAGLVQLISDYNEILTQNYGADTNKVPSANLFKARTDYYNAEFSNVKKSITSVATSLDNVKKLDDTEISGSALGLMKQNVSTLGSWKELRDPQITGLITTTETHTKNISSIRTDLEKTKTTVNDNITKITNATKAIELNTEQIEIQAEKGSEMAAALESINKQIVEIKSAIKTLATFVEYEEELFPLE